jgi:hypothetical protein
MTSIGYSGTIKAFRKGNTPEGLRARTKTRFCRSISGGTEQAAEFQFQLDPKEKSEVLLVRDSGVDDTPHFAFETSADRDAMPTFEYRVNSTLAGLDANEVVPGDPVRTMDLCTERAKFFSGARENVID